MWMSLYYGNGGPGPATKLLRVDAPPDATIDQWRRAPAERWSVSAGWKPEIHAQLDIECLGEFFMVDESQVPDIQAQMLAVYGRV